MRLRSERLTWREIDNEIVALDLESSSYFTANSTASVLIKRLADGAVGVQDLVDVLTAEFDVDLGKAEADVEQFIRALDSQGLLDMESD
jgi:Coenzyme PQQ synthesis protein D (PqqD)